MEFSLHRQLKALHGDDVEVTEGNFRADAIGPSGVWVEIQTGPLGPLRGKLERLLPHREVGIVKPVVVERRIVKRGAPDGPDLSARRSPWRGALVEVFDDLVGLARVFPHPRLRIDVLAVAIDEVRVPRRRWPGYRVADRRLVEVRQSVSLHAAADLWSLLPAGIPEPFTTLELAARLDRPVGFAQRVAYCLRLSGAAVQLGKRGNRLIYGRPAPVPPAPKLTSRARSARASRRPGGDNRPAR